MNAARTRAVLPGAIAASLAAMVLGAACTPDVGSDPVPAAMQFDLTATPPRAPQPTLLVVNPATMRIDFGLTGTPLPEDCADQQALTQAQCEFNKYLETLDGFPTVSTASAPASAELDPATLTLGQNVVVVGVRGSGLVTDVAVGFDPETTSLTIAPTRGWTLGEFYWVGVRGYGNGVRAADGREVVGSPTMSLLKQEEPLTCGATSPDEVDPHCPALEVVGAADRLFQLEAVRAAYNAAGSFTAMEMAGLPREEIAVLFGFPIHTGSVPVLAPPAVVPRVLAPNQIAVGVQGPVDPATVSAFVATEQNGPVVVMDLTAAAANDLQAGFPRVAAAYAQNAIVIQASQPFPAGHQIGVFLTNAIKSPDMAPLVPSPVSVLLTLRGALVDGEGKSTVSGIADADAAALEAGRLSLAPLLDSGLFTALTGVSRANLVYAFAFTPPVQP